MITAVQKMTMISSKKIKSTIESWINSVLFSSTLKPTQYGMMITAHSNKYNYVRGVVVSELRFPKMQPRRWTLEGVFYISYHCI